MKPKKTASFKSTSLRTLPVLILLAFPATAFAQSPYTWTGALTGGAQPWATDTNWSGAGTPNAIDDVANTTANFSAAMTLNLGAPITLGSLTLNDNTTPFVAITVAPSGGNLIFDVTGGNASVLSGGATHIISSGITLNDPLTVLGNSGLNLTGVVSSTGADGISMAGNGPLTLTAVNTYTGSTNANGGTLLVDTATNGTVLNTTSSLGVAGGTFQLKGLSGAARSQIMNGLSVSSNIGIVDVVNVAGATSTTLDLRGVGGTAGITRTTGGSVDFRASTGGPLNATNAVIKTAQANDASGILGAWATVNSGLDLAAKDGSGNIVNYTGYTDVTRLASGTKTITSSATSNVRILEGTGAAATITPAAAGTTDISTLLVQGTTATTTYDPAADDILRLPAVGSINLAPAAFGLVIGGTANDGKLTAGGAADTPGQLILNNNAGSRDIVINSTLVDNGTGALSVIKTGTPFSSWAGNNTFTGGVTIQRGTIQILGAAANTTFGTGPITFELTPTTLSGATPSIALNANVNKVIENNIVQNSSAVQTGVQFSQISVNGGTSSHRTITFNGSFTTGPNYNNLANNGAPSLNLLANGNATGLAECSMIFNGDWSGYVVTNGNAAQLDGGGFIINSDSSIAKNGDITPHGTYRINGNSAVVSTKIILNGDFIMPNEVRTAGSGNGLRNSVGSRNLAGTTAAVNGLINNLDTDGINLFSQFPDAILQIKALGGAQPVRVNDSYTLTLPDAVDPLLNVGVNSLHTPTGIVNFSRDIGTMPSNVSVMNGTFLANNANTAFSATGPGQLSIGGVGAAVTGKAGSIVNTSTTATLTTRAFGGFNTATAQTLQIGQTITGTNIPGGTATITGITLGSGADNSTIVIDKAFPAVAINSTVTFTADLATVAKTTTAVLGGTGSIVPTGTNGVIVNPGSSVGFLDGLKGDLDINLSGTGNAVFSTGAKFAVELSVPDVFLEADLVKFTGMADASIVNFNNNVVDFTALAGAAPGTYTLFTFDGAAQADNYDGTLVAGIVPAELSFSSFTYNPTNIQVTFASGALPPYDDWADNYAGFTPTGPALDFDNDGLQNLLEFVLGGDPRVNDTPSIRPDVTSSGADLVVTFKRSDVSELAPGVTVKVQVSADLVAWNPANDITIGTTNGSGPNGASYTVDETSALDTIVVTIPKAAATKKFARVVATN